MLARTSARYGFLRHCVSHRQARQKAIPQLPEGPRNGFQFANTPFPATLMFLSAVHGIIPNTHAIHHKGRSTDVAENLKLKDGLSHQCKSPSNVGNGRGTGSCYGLSWMTMERGHSYITLAWLVRSSCLSRWRPVVRSMMSRKT